MMEVSPEIGVERVITSINLEYVNDPTQYYEATALNFIIGSQLRHDSQVQLIPLNEFQNLEERLTNFKSDTNIQGVIIPIRPIDLATKFERQHFTSIYIARRGETFHATYIDPAGYGIIGSIPKKITDNMHDILSITPGSIVSTINKIQHKNEDGYFTNVHCGPFTGFVLTGLANGDIRVEGNILQQRISDTWQAIPDHTEEDSKLAGESIRQKNHILLTEDANKRQRRGSEGSEHSGSRSADSGSEYDESRLGDLSQRRFRIGVKDGDHTIAYAAIIQASYSATEYEHTQHIPDILNEISKALGLSHVCLQDGVIDNLKEIKKLRDNRKELTQNIRRMSLIRRAIEVEDGKKLSDYVTITIVKEGLGEENKTEAARRLKDSMDFFSQTDEERLGVFRDAIKETEKGLTTKLISPIAEEFVRTINQRPTASYPKERIREQRDKRIQNADKDAAKHPLCSHILKITSEDRLKLINDTSVAPQLKKDLEYANRIKGEGARVDMAVKGLTAFNRLIAISTEPNCETKQEMIHDFQIDTDLISGIKGTDVNPTFRVTKEVILHSDLSHYLWNITNDAHAGLLETMCKTAGSLFDKTLDFERVKVDCLEDQDQIDGEQLTELYNISAHTIAFMFNSFKQLKKLSPQLQEAVISEFAANIIHNQGWEGAKVRSGKSMKNLSAAILQEEWSNRLNERDFSLKTQGGKRVSNQAKRGRGR